MVAELTPETVADPPTVSPGYCADHPTEELVTAKGAGLRSYWYGRGPAPAVFCPAKGHNDNDRPRCRWCGGRLVDDGIALWRVSIRRLFCSANHRLKAHRAGKR